MPKALCLNACDVMVPRKARREITLVKTVLKLPLVGEASSLRRSEELGLRNSAN